MQTTARLRLTAEDHAALQAAAKAERSSVSAKVREAMTPYLTGEKTLPSVPRVEKQTTFTCYVDDFQRFKEIAAEAGVPWDEAMRLIVKEHLANHKS